MADLIVLKNGTWHVRLDVPEDLRNAIGRRVLTKSLKTGSKAEANAKKHAIIAEWKSLFEEARRRQASDEWKEQAQESGFEVAQTRKEAALIAVGEESPEQLSAAELARIPELIDQAVSERIIHADAGAALKQHLLFLLRELAQATTVDAKLLLHKELANAVGYFDVAKLSHLYGLSDAKTREAFEIVGSPSAFKPKSPFTPARLEKFAAFLTTRKGIVPRTVSQQVSHLKRMGKFIEDGGLRLDFDSIGFFLDSLACSPATRQQYTFAGNSFWNWAIKYDQGWKESYRGTESPFLKHDHPKAAKSETAGGYIPFSPEEVEQLHKAALDRADYDLADVIAIGAYTGCRLEEIGRINLSSITLKNDKPFSFQINEAKSKAGERELPLHSDIVPIIQRRLASSPDGYIFPGPTNKNGERLNALGKRFGYLKKSLGFGPKQVFHSLRKTFTDMLRHASVPYTTVTYLTGHKINHITYDTYSAGPSIEQKLAAIGNVKFSLTV